MQQLTQICQVRGNWANWRVLQDCSEEEFQSAEVCTGVYIHSVCERTTAKQHRSKLSAWPTKTSPVPVMPSEEICHLITLSIIAAHSLT